VIQSGSQDPVSCLSRTESTVTSQVHSLSPAKELSAAPPSQTH
jgi:hypothetical protein